MSRKDILEAASKAVHAEDKEHDYGKPEDNFATIAELWNTYLEAVFNDSESDARVYLCSRDVAAMMILLKIARVASSIKDDHWVDIAGYAACGGEVDSCEALCSKARKIAEDIQRKSASSGEGSRPLERRYDE